MFAVQKGRFLFELVETGIEVEAVNRGENRWPKREE